MFGLVEWLDGMHGVDEFVLVDDLVTVAKVYAMTIVDWCGL